MPVDTTASILITTDTVGGVWTYTAELARGLAERGVDVHLASMGGPVRDAQREHIDSIAGVTLHESDWRLEWMANPWDDVDRAGQWLLELEAGLRPSLVHLNQFAFGALGFESPTLVVAHSCVLSWWQAVRGVPAPAEWDAYHVRVSRGLAGADLVAAPTHAMLKTLADNYGYTRHGRVLPNGRDAAEFQPAAKRPYILCAGRMWDDAKNLAALEAVAPQLDWPVRVAGSCIAPHGGELKPRGIEVLGELSNAALSAQMSNAAIYALPARYEPFGLSVLEAALCGCALVLGDIPSLREVWADAAVYVPPDDSAALRFALRALIADDAARARLAVAARTRAFNFDRERMLAAYAHTYTELQPALGTLLEKTICV